MSTPIPTTCKYSLSERLVCLCKCRPHVHRCRQKPAGDTGSCELPYMVTAHQRRTQGRMGLCVEIVCKEKKIIQGRNPRQSSRYSPLLSLSSAGNWVLQGPWWSHVWAVVELLPINCNLLLKSCNIIYVVGELVV